VSLGLGEVPLYGSVRGGAISGGRPYRDRLPSAFGFYLRIATPLLETSGTSLVCTPTVNPLLR
jgi:hypothetical protein